MKKIISFLLLLLTSFLFSQEDLMYIFDTKFAKDQMYIQAKNWFNTTFKAIEKKTKKSVTVATPEYDFFDGINENGFYKILNNDDTNYSIIAEIICFKVKTAIKSFNGDEIWGLKFNLVLEFKDNKYRILIKNQKYEIYQTDISRNITLYEKIPMVFTKIKIDENLENLRKEQLDKNIVNSLKTYLEKYVW